MRYENALRYLVEILGVGEACADVAIGIPRLVDHVRWEIYVAKADGAVWLNMDLRARHRMTVFVVAALLVIPAMDKHHRN